ncbi:Carbohydrate binding family 6 [Chthoniobacter flavus Ellin428]|uniref:Carbohydrate binding family 6 n=1 Tax=Chthoniobacter flavus Ellin428 TaxID=497964 RepID=B4D9C5_9BACT|nr:Carbohydrate binding family 6 [Chthoniobacter flavus Ellin428]
MLKNPSNEAPHPVNHDPSGKSRFASLQAAALVLALLGSLIPRAFATNYYVATTGSDGNPGTLSLPFQHIQKAASTMVAGDVCYIRAGVYRETVTPANSGNGSAAITYQPYGSESVTVSGADVVTGWSVYSGGIYQAPFTGSLGDSDQVFVDGQMMNLARWPNTTLDVSRPVKATAATGSYNTTANSDGTYTGTYTDPALTQPAGFFNGARIHTVIGPVWVAQTGTVTSSASGSLQFSWHFGGGTTYIPQAGNPYYLFGLLSLLDTPSEWFIDASAHLLYLWPPQNDSPANHLVEAKQRTYGFDLRGRGYITIQGISLFACAINSSSTSQYLTLDHLHCSYVSHYSLNDTTGGFGPHMEDSGLILNGTHHILSNSTIAYSAGNGVTLLGTYHLVENCTIHDVDYLEVDCGAVNTGNSSSTSTNHEIADNTCYNGARSLFVIRSLQAGYIHNNDLYRSMLRTTDGGSIYTYNHSGLNTEIAYNKLHDNICAGNPAVGVYLDNNSSNFIVDHNLIYNTQSALQYNLPSVNILWYNNTAIGISKSLTGSFTGSQSGTQVVNNIFTSTLTTYTGATLSNNITSTTNPLFASPATLDFTVQSGSPAVDAGLVESPYTNGYAGTAPDIGAFESTVAPWTAGSPLDTGIPATPTNLTGTPGATSVQLSWTDNSTNETNYLVERSTNQQTFTQIACLPANTTSYTDSTVLPGTYYYRVRADESGFSNYATVAVTGHNAFATIQAGSLDAQSGLTVQPSLIGSCDNGDWAEYANVDFQNGAAQITLQVASGATSATNYIEVHLGSLTGPLLANINVLGTGSYSTYTSLSSAMTPVSGVQTIYLLFKGGFGICNMEYFSFTPTSTIAAPPAPTGSAAATVSQNGLLVTWTPPGTTELGFKIERSTDNQNFTEIASLATGTSSLSDSNLLPGTTYYYRLRTYNQNGFSGYTSIASAVTWTNQQAWRNLYYGTISNSGNAADSAAPDGDGITNLNKYIFGLPPGHVELPSALTVVSVTPAQTTLRFTATPASGTGYQGVTRTYDLWSASNLSSGPWAPVPSYTGIVGDGQIHNCIVPSSGTPQYFRLNVTVH